MSRPVASPSLLSALRVPSIMPATVPAIAPTIRSTVVLALALLVAAGGALARSSDRNQPLDVESNSNDCSIADDGPCTFTGNVRMVQGTLVVHAARANVQRGGGDIRRVILTGSPVTLSQELDNGSKLDARANQVDYDMTTDTVVFTGNANIDQPGRGSIAGDRIVYNMKSGQVQSGGEGGGRVKMRILPKNARPQSDTQGGG